MGDCLREGVPALQLVKNTATNPCPSSLGPQDISSCADPTLRCDHLRGGPQGKKAWVTAQHPQHMSLPERRVLSCAHGDPSSSANALRGAGTSLLPPRSPLIPEPQRCHVLGWEAWDRGRGTSFHAALKPQELRGPLFFRVFCQRPVHRAHRVRHRAGKRQSAEVGWSPTCLSVSAGIYCGRWNGGPQRRPYPNPRTCETVTSHAEGPHRCDVVKDFEVGA